MKLIALLGHPIKHSLSPLIQNAGIDKLNLNWRYFTLDTPVDKLYININAARELGYIGLNITAPHKVSAMNMVDVLDDSVKIYSAINTIKFENIDNRTISRGFNTDADAIAMALEKDLKFKFKGAKVLLLGAGGAAQTIAIKLALSGISELYLINRTKNKSKILAERINKINSNIIISTDYPKDKIDLVINATSLGLKNEDKLPFDKEKFSLRQSSAAYDLIYSPSETTFLKLAKSVGCKTANGTNMLLYQAVTSLEIWSGQKAPVNVMRKVLKSHLKNK